MKYINPGREFNEAGWRDKFLDPKGAFPGVGRVVPEIKLCC